MGYQMISTTDIMVRLNVTEQQVVMAIYSGRLPKPNNEGCWNEYKIELYLSNWKRELQKKRKEMSSTIQSGNMSFPKHQR